MRARLIAAALAGAVLAGCGGGDDHRLSAQAYRARATRICNDSRRQTAALGKPQTTHQFKVFLTRGIAVTRRNVARLQRLTPPKDLQAAHDGIIAGERRGLAELQRLAAQLHGDGRDVAVLRRAQPELTRLSSDADARYRKAGLPACAQSG
jgi:hypothetical protein